MILDTEQQTLSRYRNLSLKKVSGATYTPPTFAAFVAQSMLNSANLEGLNEIKICDPAVGDGELLIALINELKQKGSFDIHVSGFDINEEAVRISKERISEHFPDVDLNIKVKDFIELCLESSQGLTNERYDFIIANPPYVRTQILGAEQAGRLAEQFKLKGRIDLSSTFLLGISNLMHSSTVAGIIVSNRFMTTKAGTSVRASLLERFSFQAIWDLGDTKLFDAAVLPSVLIYKIKNFANEIEKIPFVSVYSSRNEASLSTDSLFENLDKSGTIKFKNISYEVKRGDLYFEKAGDVWRINDSSTDLWLNQVAQNTYCTFRDVGKIRVGVKTTADNVFIKDDWDKRFNKPELLRQLITHHGAQRFRTSSDLKYQILYPHEVVDGKRVAIDLEMFPHTKEYLNSHKVQLEGRKYVIEAKRKWYEIWVPQDPSKWNNLKVVFRDICEKPTFWLDDQGSVVNGDCYWICQDEGKSEDFLWLILAVANSTFIESFYDHKFNNKLYSGRRRFMTQYVEQFPLPNPEKRESKEVISLVKRIYKEMINEDTSDLERNLDKKIWELFGVGQ